MERRNLIYVIVLTILCAGIAVVTVAILRKRAEIGAVQQLQTLSPGQAGTVRSAPAAAKPIRSYAKDRPYQEGDPIPKYRTEPLMERAAPLEP